MGSRRLAAALLLAVAARQGGAPAATLGEILQEKSSGNAEAVASQERIDVLSDSTDELAAEYRRAVHDTQALRAYNQQVKELIAAQEREMVSLQDQIENVTVISRQVMPLMLRMIDTLDAFVALDVPFLLEERRKRVAGLREMMDRADVTISEKYRRILEAYQIENEYGRTIEAYRAPMPDTDESRTVDFLRVGRVALLYQTLDAKESGMWDPETKAWAHLDDEYRAPVRQGLRMARKQVAPDLVEIPVPAPQEVGR